MRETAMDTTIMRCDTYCSPFSNVFSLDLRWQMSASYIVWQQRKWLANRKSAPYTFSLGTFAGRDKCNLSTQIQQIGTRHDLQWPSQFRCNGFSFNISMHKIACLCDSARTAHVKWTERNCRHGDFLFTWWIIVGFLRVFFYQFNNNWIFDIPCLFFFMEIELKKRPTYRTHLCHVGFVEYENPQMKWLRRNEMTQKRVRDESRESIAWHELQL
jgi:hypothetical protein